MTDALNRATLLRIALLAATALAGGTVPVSAQEKDVPAPPVAAPADAETAGAKVPVLDMIRYDADREGVLLYIPADGTPLFVSGLERDTLRESVAGKTPFQFAPIVGARLTAVGAIRVLVPQTMTVLNPPPTTPADPFAGMGAGDRMQLLVSLFEEEQWQKAGSAGGIGLADMTDAQRALFAGVLGGEDRVPIETYKSAVNEQGETYLSRVKEGEQSVPVAGLRLRLSRKVSLQFKRGSDPYFGYGGWDDSDSDVAAGTIVTQMDLPGRFGEDAGEAASAYGFSPIAVVPNRLKPGDLDFKALAWNTPVPLDGSLNTVGKLLSAVQKATRFELVADPMYSKRPVGMRLPRNGASVRAGDLLEAVCRSVNGAFRRVAPQPNTGSPAVLLLTDDREGIGTRVARLDLWATVPKYAREEGIRKAVERLSARDPLRYFAYKNDDPLAPPPALQKALEEELRRDPAQNPEPQKPAKDPTVVGLSDLSPALRASAERQIEKWATMEEPVNLRSDAIKVSAEMRAEWVLPDGRVLPARFYGGFDGGFLQRIARKPFRMTPPPDAGKPLTKLPATVSRRVAILPLPVVEADMSEWFALLRRKGFREVWFRVPFVPDREARLKAAIASGKAAGFAVGATAGWLLKTEANPGVPEATDILGRTGAEWAKTWRFPMDGAPEEWAQPFRDIFVPNLLGWITPRRNDGVVTHAARLAALPGLSAFAIENTAPPGYVGGGGSDFWADVTTQFGYDAETRYTCVKEKGFDPIDVSPRPQNLGIPLPSPYSETDGRRETWAQFRAGRNAAYLAGVWRGITERVPRAPLYIASLERFPAAQFTYFARWTDAGKVPMATGNAGNNAAEARSQAAAVGEPLLAFVALQNPVMEAF